MMKPIRLKIINYYSSIGIDTASPIFGWQLESELRNQQQTHYRIVLARQEESVIDCEDLLWDSGKVCSSEQYGIIYQGQLLQSVTAYYWRVAVWNQQGDMVWSESQKLFTGYLDEEAWKAEWIGIGGLKPFYARTEFSSRGQVKRAYALVSGLGHFKLFMNGEKIGPNEMDPGWTNYDKSVQYRLFLCDGEHS